MCAAKSKPPTQKQAGVYAAIARDRCSAELVIPRSIDRAAITLRACLDAVEDKGVAIDEAVITAVRDIVASPPPLGEERRYVIAQSRCAVDGLDGRIDWLIHSGYVAPEETLEAVDHYERAALPLVETDQVMGRIIAPTAGIDGCDVCGKPIKASPGREASINHDETIRIDEDRIVACACGLLETSGGQAHVREMIDIKGNVDFSTGHVEYKRDIRVRGGVGDRFRINAGGHLLVEGLTEAATIETGGDFEARGGMVGYPNGTVLIGGKLVARYLDSVTGRVAGELHVEREVIHCDLCVTGAVDISSGALIGGTLTAAGAVRVGMLGSGAGVATALRSTAVGTAMDIQVTRKLHPGVTFIAGARRYYFNRALRGPLRITCGEDGVILLERGGKPTPINMVNGVT